MTKVRDAMTEHPRTLSFDDSVPDAARIMKDEDVGSVPVVDTEGCVVGIVTDRDIVIRAVVETGDTQAVKVGDVASRDPFTVDADEELEKALAVMARQRIRRLPVVENGRLVGVLAQADVALEGSEGQTGEMLEQISQPGPAQSRG
jgi:signal-transduction protein with cAMP-binding, CBS, and nucleotidyltransferase domain